MTPSPELLQQDAIELLKALIKIPSLSKEEEHTADLIAGFLQARGIEIIRIGHNICARNLHFDLQKPVILLNSHHDTVKANNGYTLDPYDPIEEGTQLFGLGSNDAGGCLVALIAAFIFFYDKTDLSCNLVLAATAEEEISGSGGITSLWTNEVFNAYTGFLEHKVHWSAIVGEPTQLQMAVVERGLLVVDVRATGKAGHAARKEGENALYKALEDIDWLRNYTFEKVSDFLGPVQLSVTSIETPNKQHNVVPDTCDFVIDIRVNECYDMASILHILQAHLHSRIKARSTRLRPSSIALNHPLVLAGTAMGLNCFGSPTTSDKALMPFPAVKMGPGDSARSHTANEFIFIPEIAEGIATYIQLLARIIL
ncbi:acetylornithine deacetylase [Taibaiella sp. KBW10]|uniref:M20/M25/M40 family metallo-hydrolase n=1 Tax=Taibaiella sp. KBW10 TaxID=2153357 RepID=UPI000F5AF0B4|nr:M20/M25/M40 family metallo-hydrolase [Taibaiella sp. KBW10]RQO30879.1 acetylornithine deacetylase [Taibaiella sp. KBW10]